MHAKYEVVKLISGYAITRRPHGEIEGVYDSYVEAERAACEMSPESLNSNLNAEDHHPEPLNDLIDRWQASGRVCPLPQCWSRFWELLSSENDGTIVSLPPPPLILAAWGTTSEWHKKMRLREQLEWALKAGIIAQAIAFLESLKDDDWCHR